MTLRSSYDEMVTHSEEWSDDERMNVMFAPMRQKNLNPESWNSKLSFWSSLIQRWCMANKKSSVTLEELERAFERKGKAPHCLQDILIECQKSGELVEHDRFLTSLAPIETWGGWVTGLGWNLVQSVSDKIKGHQCNNYVQQEVVHKLMEEMYKSMKDIETPLKFKQFLIVDESQLVNSQDDESQKILQYLCMRKSIASIVVDDSKYYKISLDNSVTSISDTDQGIIKLYQSLQALEKDIELLENEVKTLALKIKQLLKSNSRQSAKSVLQRQKVIETNLDKKLKQKLNVESLLDEILGAESNKIIVDSLKAGLGALKVTLQDKSLLDVDELMEEIGDTLSKGDDLSKIVSKDLSDVSSLSSDLEAELDNLSSKDSDLDISVELNQPATSQEDEELLNMLEQLDCEIQPKDKNQRKEQFLLAA